MGHLKVASMIDGVSYAHHEHWWYTHHCSRKYYDQETDECLDRKNSILDTNPIEKKMR